jgi:hypothetical protein
MGIGEHFAVICAAAIPDGDERALVLRELTKAGHEPLEISIAEMHGFAGNLLALQSTKGRRLIALSSTAWNSLSVATRARLEQYGEIITAAIPMIERYGGGSVRCMIAEVFLPRSGTDGRC